MKVEFVMFTGISGIQREMSQSPGNNAIEGYIGCVFRLETGEEVNCRTSIKQTPGATLEEILIEVGPVEELPASAEYDHNAFAEKVRKYYIDAMIPASEHHRVAGWKGKKTGGR